MKEITTEKIQHIAASYQKAKQKHSHPIGKEKVER